VKKETESTEETLKIPKLVVGLGPSVGRSGPFPVEIDVPTKDGPKMATFYGYAFDQNVLDELEELGVSTNVFEQDQSKLRAQNRCLPVLLIDKDRGWKDLFRWDGDEFEYVIPDDETEGTAEDCRVMLATGAVKLFGTFKGKCYALCTAINVENEKNSESSSATTSTRQAKAKPKRRRASSKKSSAPKAK